MVPYPEEIPPPAPRSSTSGCKTAAIVVAAVSCLLMCLGGVGGLSLFVVVLPRARESYNRANCRNNLREIALGVHEYELNYGFLPAAQDFPENQIMDKSGAQVTPSVFWLLLPYMGLDTMYNAPGGMNTQTASAVKLFLCLSDPSSASTSGLASSCYVLSQPIFSRDKANISVAMADGTSQTVMGGERLQTCGDSNPAVTQWGSPTSSLFAVSGLRAPDYQNTSTGSSPSMNVQAATNQSLCVSSNTFQSAHPDGVQVMMGDGRAATIPASYAPANLGYFCTPSGRGRYSNSPLPADF